MTDPKKPLFPLRHQRLCASAFNVENRSAHVHVREKDFGQGKGYAGNTEQTTQFFYLKRFWLHF
jgi:hypothetical protein